MVRLGAPDVAEQSRNVPGRNWSPHCSPTSWLALWETRRPRAAGTTHRLFTRRYRYRRQSFGTMYGCAPRDEAIRCLLPSSRRPRRTWSRHDRFTFEVGLSKLPRFSLKFRPPSPMLAIPASLTRTNPCPLPGTSSRGSIASKSMQSFSHRRSAPRRRHFFSRVPLPPMSLDRPPRACAA